MTKSGSRLQRARSDGVIYAVAGGPIRLGMDMGKLVSVGVRVEVGGIGTAASSVSPLSASILVWPQEPA